jgi:hypothetical protein
MSKRKYVSPYFIATVYAGPGDKDSAFRWLAIALKERSDLLVSLKVDPVFASLRSDSRFADLLRRIRHRRLARSRVKRVVNLDFAASSAYTTEFLDGHELLTVEHSFHSQGSRQAWIRKGSSITKKNCWRGAKS